MKNNTVLGDHYQDLVEQLNEMKFKGREVDFELFIKDSTRMDEISRLMKCINRDTGLFMNFLIYKDSDTNKMHLVMIAKWSNEE